MDEKVPYVMDAIDAETAQSRIALFLNARDTLRWMTRTTDIATEESLNVAAAALNAVVDQMRGALDRWRNEQARRCGEDDTGDRGSLGDLSG